MRKRMAAPPWYIVCHEFSGLHLSRVGSYILRENLWLEVLAERTKYIAGGRRLEKMGHCDYDSSAIPSSKSPVRRSSRCIAVMSSSASLRQVLARRC